MFTFIQFLCHILALHALLVWGERTRGWQVGVLGWLFLPLPLLFHPAFLAGCLWPLIGIR